jgi:hypothetical protein
MWILWPSFLMACVLELIVFAFIDPEAMEFMGQPLEWSRSAVYSISFFMFWLFAATSSALTTLLAQSPFELNRCPLERNERPGACPKEPC